MIKVGDLVRYKEDGDIGLVTEINYYNDVDDVLYWCKWSDGTEGDHLAFELEVIG